MDYSFVFGQPVWGEHYANRKLLTEELVRHMNALKSSILISPRGWGKRSFALHIGKLLSDQDYTIRTCYIGLHGINSIEEFCQSYAQVFYFDLEMFTLDPNSLRDHLDEVLAIPEYIAVRDRIKHIIFIGHIEQIAGFEDSQKFQQKLRTTWKLQSHCAYFLYGNDLTTKKLLSNSSHNPIKRIGRCFNLPRIHHEELTEFIQKRFQQTGKQISERAAALIASNADCIPNYVQLLAWHAWIRTETECSEKEVFRALDQLSLQNNVQYEILTDSLTKKQVRYLIAHLQGDQRLCSKITLQEFNLGSSSNVARLRDSLINKEILGTEIGGPFLLDPIYGYWLNHYYFGIP